MDTPPHPHTPAGHATSTIQQVTCNPNHAHLVSTRPYTSGGYATTTIRCGLHHQLLMLPQPHGGYATHNRMHQVDTQLKPHTWWIHNQINNHIHLVGTQSHTHNHAHLVVVHTWYLTSTWCVRHHKTAHLGVYNHIHRATWNWNTFFMGC